MQILIHACPKRMWYVEDFLVPRLREQGAKSIEIWNDADHRGNLMACMESFAARKGDGGTWHIQDDVLPCRDFVQRCEQLDDGVVYGFCQERFTDDPHQTGKVYTPDAWHSFQCVRIPDSYARECAEWFYTDQWQESRSPELPVLKQLNKGDDSFFHEFLEIRHGYETVTNVRPCLVDHIDWIIGGSILSQWRDFLPRASWWDDEELVEELETEIRRYKRARS